MKLSRYPRAARALRVGLLTGLDLSGKHSYQAMTDLLPTPRKVTAHGMWARATQMTRAGLKQQSKLTRRSVYDFPFPW